jgi:YNFM family putative membrane transporter
MDGGNSIGAMTEIGNGAGSAARSPAPGWTERGTQAYRRISIALFLAGFATFSLLYCVQPLLPDFSREFGVDATESSLALSLATGFLALAILCAGAVSEAVGRRRLIFASIAGSALLNILAALAPSWHALLLARALEGFALGGVPAVAMAYLAEEIHPRGLGFAMGLYIGGSAFGGMFGRVGTGILTDLASWRAALGGLGALDLLAAIGFILLLPPSRNFVRRPGFQPAYHVEAWAAHLRHDRLPFLFAIGWLAMGAFVTIYNYADFRLVAPPYRLSQTEIGLVFMAYLFGIGASPVAGALADRYGRGPVVIAGLLIEIAGIGLTLLPGLGAMITGVVGLTIGFFIAHSAASSWIGRLAVTAKGHAASLYLLAYYLGSSVMGSIGGWFWTEGGWPALVAFTGGLLILALVCAVLVQWRARVASAMAGGARL